MNALAPFGLLLTLALPPAASAKVTTRAAYVCQALISNANSKMGPQAGDASFAQRVSQRLGQAANQLQGRHKIAVVGTLRRMHADLMKLKNGQFAVKQELVGEKAIRNYLDRVKASSERLESTHKAADATHPFQTQPVFARDLTQAGIATGIVGGFTYLAGELFHHDHRILGTAAAALTFGVIWKALVPFLHAVVSDIRNVVMLKLSARGRPVRGISSAEISGQSFGEFATEIQQALGSGDKLKSTILMGRSRVALPISSSTTAFWTSQRLAPTAAQILAAIRRSGNYPFPADSRVLEVDHLFYFDAVQNQPVLITFVRECGRY